ncbi:J domain-containing protein 1 [Neurospora sp. IMI 360204]|nr:J domain-containing protein 1 [Neurospora sp. IMI 360204]
MFSWKSAAILCPGNAALATHGSLTLVRAATSSSRLCGPLAVDPVFFDLRPIAPTARGAFQTRRFASVHHGAADAELPKDHPALHWPASKNPTPYDIFGQSKNDPYNKRRFHELVKLYHPDRHPHPGLRDIPHPTKLERYRLVVAANDILSNTQKRRMYDLYDFGWSNHPDLRNDDVRSTHNAWHRRPGNASMNATWEDWEQWRNEQESGGTGQQQKPIFVSNGAFVVIVSFFVVIGSWQHATHGVQSGVALVDAHEQTNAAINKELRQRYGETAGLGREARVDNFLKQRNGWDNYPTHPHHISGYYRNLPSQAPPLQLPPPAPKHDGN